MWAQEWGNIYPIVAPKGSGDFGYEIGDLLTAKGYDPLKMVNGGENFYSSLGFAPLPDTFWTRSQITKPRDRDVVCHASAWDIDSRNDVRIKMCTKVVSDDFVTIHHELGHNYYQRAYQNQDFLHQDGANDGFHEAIGDFNRNSRSRRNIWSTSVCSIPPRCRARTRTYGLLLRQAMDKVAFLPFGLLVDPLALGGVRRLDQAGRLQQGVDRHARQISWASCHRSRANADSFDPGCQVPHPEQHALHALFPGAGAAVPVLLRPRAKQAGWTGPLQPLLVLKQQDGGHEPQQDAGNGRVQALAPMSWRFSLAAARSAVSR